MTYPTIHLNGTSLVDLIKQYEEAHQSVYHAVLETEKASPNARDYYPQGDSASYEARQEHIHRMERLRDVLRELEQILLRLHEEAMNRAIFIEG